MPEFDWLEVLANCPSTNTWAIANAEKLQHGSVVFTPKQTAGRGQHGRVWSAPPGVLTASFIIDRFPVQRLPGFSLVVGLAVIRAISDLIPTLQDVLRLKWSNDILIEQRKLAGILCETSISGSTTRVVVGIGLNRAADLSTVAGNPISLHELVEIVPDEMQLLERLRHHLLEVSAIGADSGLEPFLVELSARDVLRDRILTIELAGQEITGQAIGIDQLGRLQLRLPNGQIQTLTSGHILRWS
jgi:BirA family transcriptional regulator, biotin operon repressor / biotin---[acetyl-CoA-carboxylase] ligase